MQTVRRALAAAALVLGLALLGCGGDDGSDASDQPQEAKSNLRVGVRGIPETLDPGQNFQREHYAIMQLIEGTLTEQEPDGKDVRMGLAESVESGEGRYVVTLRSNLKFSDGSALTSKDVVASFDYYMADDTNGYGYTFAPIKDVVAEDDLTVAFELKQPYPSLPFVLALPSSAIVPSEQVGKGMYEGKALPTAAPYQVKSFGRKAIEMVKNPNYWGKKKAVKEITFTAIPDPAARLTQVQGGEIDFADGISPHQAEQVKAPVEVRSVVAVNGVTFVVANNREPGPLSDVKVRRAIALAIDRNQINEIAYAGKNEPALSLWANASRYNDPFLEPEADVEAAKKQLVGTECENGCKLGFLGYSDDEALGQIGVVVQQNLKEIGIDVQIEKADGSTVRERTTEGNYDLNAGFFYDVADFPDGYLLFALVPDGSGRLGYNSKEMAEAIDAGNVAVDDDEREAAISKVNEIFERDLPMIPVADIVVVSGSRVPASTFDVEPTLFYHVG